MTCRWKSTARSRSATLRAMCPMRVTMSGLLLPADGGSCGDGRSRQRPGCPLQPNACAEDGHAESLAARSRGRQRADVPCELGGVVVAGDPGDLVLAHFEEGATAQRERLAAGGQTSPRSTGERACAPPLDRDHVTAGEQTGQLGDEVGEGRDDTGEELAFLLGAGDQTDAGEVLDDPVADMGHHLVDVAARVGGVEVAYNLLGAHRVVL